MDPSMYKDDWEVTNIEDLEFVRSPFYDLARMYKANEGKETYELLEYC